MVSNVRCVRMRQARTSKLTMRHVNRSWLYCPKNRGRLSLHTAPNRPRPQSYIPETRSRSRGRSMSSVHHSGAAPMRFLAGSVQSGSVRIGDVCSSLLSSVRKLWSAANPLRPCLVNASRNRYPSIATHTSNAGTNSRCSVFASLIVSPTLGMGRARSSPCEHVAFYAPVRFASVHWWLKCLTRPSAYTAALDFIYILNIRFTVDANSQGSLDRS